LKGVGRCAGLECTAAQDFCPALATLSAMEKICSRDSTEQGPAATTTSGPPIFYAAAEIDDGAFRLELAAGELEGLRDAHDFAHAFEQLEIAMIEVAVNADGAEDRVRFASGAMDVEAAGDEAVDNMLDLGVGGPFLHYDDHGRCLLSWTFR